MGSIKDAKGPLQEREVHRYYSAWLSAQGSSLNVANHVDSIAKADLNELGFKVRYCSIALCLNSV